MARFGSKKTKEKKEKAPTYPLSSAMRQKAKLEEEEKERVKQEKEVAKLARREAKRAAKIAGGETGDGTVTGEIEEEAMQGDQVEEEGDDKPGLGQLDAATQKSHIINLAKRFEESYDSEQTLRASEVADAEQMCINKTVLAALLKERLEIGQEMWVVFQRLRGVT